ncbi:hypothetical protein EV121DRAFT_296722 [Schizophyllum commune]
MEKKDRKNNKNWASGVREQILLAHLPKFTQELARGVKYAREYLVKILHEFNFKISYEFPDDVDPNPVPEYDLENPPPLPALSAEDEVKRAEALRIRDKRVWDWLLYRARKVVPAQPKGADDTNNPYTMYMMGLMGLSGAPKKARQGWQQYQHENPELVQASAQHAWEVKKAAGKLRPEDEEDAGSDDEDGGGDEEEVRGGKKQTKKTLGFISEHARELYNALPAQERTELLARAKAEKAAAKKRWEDALNAPPSTEPSAVQKARDLLEGFLGPIMSGVNDYCAGAHVLVLVGGREPQRGGEVTVKHFCMGTNKQNTDFAGWNPPRFNRDIVQFFSEYLDTVWDERQRAQMALVADPKPPILVDPLDAAPYRFNTEQGGDSFGDDTPEDDGPEEDDHRLSADWDDDLDDRMSKRARVDDEVHSTGNASSGTPTARASSGPRAPSPLQPPPAPPARPKAKPVRRSARNRDASSTADVSGTLDVGLDGAPADSAPAGLPSPSAPLERPANATPSLDGIPIDPELLSLRPPYTQIVPSTHRTPSLTAPLPPPVLATQSSPPRSPPPPERMRSPASLPQSTTHHSPVPFASPPSGTTNALPVVPPDAPEWFSKALSRLQVDLGSEWARLLHAWARYEGVKRYGEGRPSKTSRLDVAGCRPKEVAAWIGGGRWRSEGCEPAKKEGKFACVLMKAWWAWYIKLVPGWREEDEEGRLEDFVDFGHDVGKLDVPGVNGVLSLVFSLKWVGQALGSNCVVDDRVRTDSDWRRAIADLTKMLDGMSDL